MKKNAATDSNPFRGKHHNRAQGPFCGELHHMCLWSPYRAQQEHPLDGASDTGLSSSASSQLKLPQTLVRAPSTDLSLQHMDSLNLHSPMRYVPFHR